MQGFDLSTISAAYFTNLSGSTSPVSSIYYEGNLIWPANHDYSLDYLTFEAIETGTFTLSIHSDVTTTFLTSVSYSTDNGATWVTTMNSSTDVTITTPTINAGDKVLWKGEGTRYGASMFRNSVFSSTGRYNASGNIMSLLYGDNFIGQTTLTAINTFYKLFSGSTKLVDASNLVLAATTLTNECYSNMFYGCSNLTSAPELPATTLGLNCYANMFQYCNVLASAPELPATTLASGCYNSMFYGCAGLTTAPALPATTLIDYCYRSMFKACSSLATAPELPATTLAQSCYNSMFADCSSLTTAPELPATTLANYCYQSMFSYCTSLTTAPELPATTLSQGCYNGMFRYCRSLTTAPKLPATTLAIECYKEMFRNCTSLTTAPALPATTLVQSCYTQMFYQCSVLNYIKCYATDISATNSTANWVYNVAATGTFVKPITMTSWTIGDNGIPTGWVSQADYDMQYFTIESLENNNDIKWYYTSGYSSGAATISVSTDLSTWTQKNPGVEGGAGTTLASLNTGDKLYVRSLTQTYGSNEGYNYFTSAGKVDVYGNIMSLRYDSDFIGKTTLTHPYTFHDLLGELDIIDASNLILPATTLTSWCYSGMFNGCWNLKYAPKLPATTMVLGCYSRMFENCTSLATAPELPATTLADRCYLWMFESCTSLLEAPVLPATTLVQSCYSQMFRGCKLLSYVKCLATDISASSCTSYWLDGVATYGVFRKDESTNWQTRSVSGIPENWSSWNKDYEDEYFSISLTRPSDPVNVYFVCYGWLAEHPRTIQVSTDEGATWTSYTSVNYEQLVLIGTLEETTDRIMIKGLNNNYATEANAFNYFYAEEPDAHITHPLKLSGNIMSLVYGDNFRGQTTLPDTLQYNRTFSRMFGYFAGDYWSNPQAYQPDVRNVQQLVLPATNAVSCAYEYMFNQRLISKPPVIKATSVGDYAMGHMFQDCYNLQYAPVLKTKTLATGSYEGMFENCSVLEYLQCFATDITATNCIYYWLTNTADGITGEFYGDPNMTWPVDTYSGIPSNWNIN